MEGTREVQRGRISEVVEQFLASLLKSADGDVKCRSIGISNFTLNDLKILLKNAKIVPAVHQV